jgi:hypothetical protein
LVRIPVELVRILGELVRIPEELLEGVESSEMVTSTEFKEALGEAYKSPLDASLVSKKNKFLTDCQKVFEEKYKSGTVSCTEFSLEHLVLPDYPEAEDDSEFESKFLDILCKTCGLKSNEYTGCTSD